MKSELLMRIKDAEAAADDRVEQAQGEAQKMVADARRQAEKLIADERAKADEAYQGTLTETRTDVEEKAKKTLSNGKREATNLRKKFEEGVDGVTDRVLKLFEGTL